MSKLNKLKKGDSTLELKIDKKLNMLISYPGHNSLRLHKITTRKGVAWSISVDMKLRILFMYRDYGILLIDMGSHDQVY